MQILEMKSSRPRPKSFETETRPRLQKTGLETETQSRDSITEQQIRTCKYHNI